MAISLGFSRVDLYTESTYTRVNTVINIMTRKWELKSDGGESKKVLINNWVLLLKFLLQLTAWKERKLGPKIIKQKNYETDKQLK